VWAAKTQYDDQPNKMSQLDRKLRLATVWLGGCSGCHMSFLDLDERLIDLARRVEFAACPFTDQKEFTEADITLVEGAIANEEHLHQIKKIRNRTKVLISLGDCAVTGNVTALRNMFGVDDVLNRAYRETSTVVTGIPSGNAVIPRLLPRVRPLHEVVKVDYYIPGCPPSADTIHSFLMALLEGREPPQDLRFG
jgi:NAD-reducing hydrogenase small subunit